ncbi:Tex-like N-terminal domain-containing protein [Candidatus Pantoea persica]|uniref:Tex-like N-terminal domain-containing protein n=1 Tax=Candidatus Pantoea persica TaxID=2518128 RepID=UPI0035A8EBB6|nr:Transcription accessory protein [Candidatus Pantoea persica]
MTGGLDDTQLRQLEIRLSYLRELEDRRQLILKSIDDQGKLTDKLASAINATLNKTKLEDLYLPYKLKCRTRGQIAIEAGLQPLAETLLQDPEQLAAQYVDADKGVANARAALLAKVRDYLWKNAHLVSRMVEGKEQEGAKFRDNLDHHEALNGVPSHRALAMLSGRNEGVLQLTQRRSAVRRAAARKLRRNADCRTTRPAPQRRASAPKMRRSTYSPATCTIC